MLPCAAMSHCGTNYVRNVMNMPATLGEKIRFIRQRKALTQEALAENAKLKKLTLREIETGKRTPHFQTIRKIARALDVTPEDLAPSVEAGSGLRAARLKNQAEMRRRRKVATSSVANVANIRDPAGTRTPTTVAVVSGAHLRRPSTPEALRRNLAGKLLQVALDVSDIRDAQNLATVASTAGVDLIEVGDPLIKRFGMNVVGDIRAVCDTPIVVEFASSDWIHDQIQMACECGADIVQIIGLHNETRLRKAVQCAREFDVGIFTVIPTGSDAAQWCSVAQEAGVDAISIVRNVDCFQCSEQVMKLFNDVRSKIHRPVSIAGGFTPQQIAHIVDLPWNIAIVGSAIVNAQTPERIINEILGTIRKERAAGNG